MTIIEKILNQVSVDPRIKNGLFEISCNEHMEALRDYLTGKGIPTHEVVDFSNRVLEGKYPERQAYNKDGLLVTFPTPEYKQRAIQRGTHFEKKPVVQTNLFDKPPGGEAPKEEPSGEDKGSAKPSTTSLPLSSTASEKPEATPSTPEAPEPTNVATVDAPAAEPEPEPTELPPPEPKTTAEKNADSEAIKKILQSDDSLLQEVATWIENNGPQYILDAFKEHLKN